MPVLSKRIVLDCFYLLIFYFEKFSTDVCRLPCAVNVNLNLSSVKSRSVKRNAKNARGLGRDRAIFLAATAPFTKSRPSFFRRTIPSESLVQATPRATLRVLN